MRIASFRLLWLILLVPAACGPGFAPRLRYTGQLTGCGPAGPVTLTRSAGRFSFTPGDGTLIITGEVTADGRFAGSLDAGRSGSGTPSAAATRAKATAHFVLSVQGRIDNDTAEATYTTPRCQTTLRLTRVDEPPLLPF
jgi:hypothetical protein